MKNIYRMRKSYFNHVGFNKYWKYFKAKRLILCVYDLVQLIRTTSTNPKYLQRIFCSFTFWVLLPGKSFELRLNTSKNANTYNCYYSTILSGKDTQKVNKLKFVFREIGCSQKLNEINICNTPWIGSKFGIRLFARKHVVSS